MSRVAVGPGDADLPSLQMAVDVPGATEIVLAPGVYVEQVVIAPRPAPLEIRSATGDPRAVTITYGLRQGDLNASGMPIAQDCATVTIDADDVTVRGLTIENSFDREAAPELRDTQAIALRTRGDRVRVDGCRLLGRQDTLLLDTPTRGSVRRVLVTDCEIRGDVDIVYGRATAVISGGVVHSTGPGYIAAPSTIRENPRGLLFAGVAFTGDAPGGSVALARPWHQGGSPEALGSAEFVACSVGPHISPERWDDMGGFSWREARFAEHDADGPSASEWLRGWDGPADPSGRVVIASDSTASDYPAARAPRTGWGQVLAEVSGLEVDNHAVSGASTRSFIESGALDRALAALSPGDVLFIAFGHNDPKPDHRHAELFTAYAANLRRFLVGARSRGAIPVLATSVERRGVVAADTATTHAGYPQRVRALAREEGVPFVDLSLLSRRLWRELGEEGSREAFLWLEPGAWPASPDGERDDTHFSREGALRIARIVAGELERLGLTGIRQPRATAAAPRDCAIA
ncbi:pectinesterase family protein [Microbacterium karelineae]|uniref:pectinesterase family protein n=1 Tax=Microbacterium karelineae TaxID=2654283 RepID=UPI0012E9E296|nr:pectinesterase family protein [Microbacterium karelineae]